MEDIETMLRALASGDEPDPGPSARPKANPPLSSILRVIRPFETLPDAPPPTRRSPPQDWSDLIDRVRATMAHSKQVEADAQEQEARVRALLERVREDMRALKARASAAEAQVCEVTARTNALLKAADERVQDAEERAQNAEGWLSQIQDAVAAEMSVNEFRKLTA